MLLLILFSSPFDIEVDKDFVDTAIDCVAEVKESGVENFKRPSLLLATVLSIESLLLHPTLFALRFLSLVTEPTILSPPFTPPPPLRPIIGEWDKLS